MAEEGYAGWGQIVVVEVEKKLEALGRIVAELGDLERLAKSVGETFVTFLIASAKREAGARHAELLIPPVHEA